jgi:hypothetical protein
MKFDFMGKLLLAKTTIGHPRQYVYRITSGSSVFGLENLSDVTEKTYATTTQKVTGVLTSQSMSYYAFKDGYELEFTIDEEDDIRYSLVVEDTNEILMISESGQNVWKSPHQITIGDKAYSQGRHPGIQNTIIEIASGSVTNAIELQGITHGFHRQTSQPGINPAYLVRVSGSLS